MVARLQQHRRAQLETRLKPGEKWVDDQLIFTTEIGSLLDRHNVATRFRARCRKAGVPARRLYDLQHSVGTALIAEGNDARTVSEILGHRSLLTTMVHYVHPRGGSPAGDDQAAVGGRESGGERRNPQ